MSNLDNVKIKYVGAGVASIPGVPARDMTNDEAREYDITALLRSGLYELERPPKPKRTYFKKEEIKEEPDEEQEKDGE